MSRPRRQATHSPHVCGGQISTGSPTATVETRSPTWYFSGVHVCRYVTIIPKGSVTADPDGDRIAEVDPATGRIIRVIGATGATGLYGLGYWGGIAYGFSSSGLLVKIDLTSGAGTPIPITGAPTSGFYGAYLRDPTGNKICLFAVA